MARDPAGKLSIYAALASNLAIAGTKFVAATMTGSSAMMSEGFHSLVDTSNELLLLYGMKRASRPPDANHPFGHGRELYFWSFIVALTVLALGAAASLYEGVSQILHPRPLDRPLINYGVLAASFGFEAVSWWIGLKAFRAGKGSQGYVEAFRTSKDPTTFTVLFEDTAALIGVLIAAAGVAASHAFEAPRLDGFASIGIGSVLLVSSLLLARETKGLLIGESAHPRLREEILRITSNDPDVRTANGVLTVQLGPAQVIAALSVEFHDARSTTQVENCVNRIEAAIKRAQPDVIALFVKPQSAATWRRRVEQLPGAADEGSTASPALSEKRKLR